MDLSQYLNELHQHVHLQASVPEREMPWATAFTDIALQALSEIGEVQDPVVAAYDQPRTRPPAAAAGYAVRGDGEVLDVFVTAYDGGPGVTPLRRAEVDAAFKRAHTFVSRCADGLHEQLEESSAAYEMARRVGELLLEVAFVRLFLLTDSTVKVGSPELPQIAGLPVSCTVWDLERLQRLATSGREREPIVVDMLSFNEAPVPFLGPEGDPDDYQGYLLVLRGDVLADIYAAFGPRLLELNVRSFLQAKGKVNQGIQKTLREAPRRFLAYNNGISMTASRVDVVAGEGGQLGITAIHDLQIVNGGQTTASLFHALTKGKLPLDDVRVQAKLSVVSPSQLKEVVPLISQYANSQNAVKTADFSANHPFHVRLEELSRSTWAPAPGGGPLMTQWFYERARGQYMDALSREGSPGNQKKFKQRSPLGQKFAKTDVAKFESTWAQLPHIVSQGADRCFINYMLRVDKGGAGLPDHKHFEELVAKAILFRQSEKIIAGLQLGGYRSQTVTYTLALLSLRLGSLVDLGEIWRRQELAAPTVDLIEFMAPAVHAEIIRAAGSSNISEFAKKAACWEAVQRLHTNVGPTPQGRRGSMGGIISIHAVYADERVEAEFDLEARTVTVLTGALAGWNYNSPSGAASAVVRSLSPTVDPNRNGWLFWTVTHTGDALQSIRSPQ